MHPLSRTLLAPGVRSLAIAWGLATASAMLACKGASVDLVGVAPSPQASAEPAPLANPPAIASIRFDGGPPPEALRTDEELAPDMPREPARELGSKDQTRDARDLAGYSMQAVLRMGEGPGAPRAAEVNASAIDAMRRKTEPRMTIEVSQTRARFVLAGGFVLPQATELRARVDRYGHLLLWPGESTYRVTEPGALRALLGERRLDVAPLSPAEVILGGEGARRLNLRTHRAEVSTRAAKATLELASVRDAGDGGALVCRLLLDLMNAHPSTPVCATDDIPLHAEVRWTTQGSLAFDVISLLRRFDLLAQDLGAPPPSLEFAPSPPPSSQAEALIQKADFAAFRTAALDIPLATSPDAQPPPPEGGLLLINSGDELRVAWIDGVPAAWVAPGGRLSLPSLVRGRYALQWRTFLGDGWEPPATLVVPGTSEVGARVVSP